MNWQAPGLSSGRDSALVNKVNVSEWPRKTLSVSLWPLYPGVHVPTQVLPHTSEHSCRHIYIHHTCTRKEYVRRTDQRMKIWSWFIWETQGKWQLSQATTFYEELLASGGLWVWDQCRLHSETLSKIQNKTKQANKQNPQGSQHWDNKGWEL